METVEVMEKLEFKKVYDLSKADRENVTLMVYKNGGDIYLSIDGSVFTFYTAEEIKLLYDTLMQYVSKEM